MAYNRWLSSNYLEHHGVKGQQWGVTNGPPYPLDRSKSDGHKLIKGDGSPQGKKKYTASQKTAHKRALRKSRAEATSETERDIKRLNNFFNRHVGWDNVDAVDRDGSLNRRLEELYNGVDRGTITKESFVKEASGIRDEIRRRIDAEVSNGSEWAPEVQKHLKDVDTYHRGVDEDKYEMPFLEAIQNEDWEINNDKKRRDKEYAEYLRDREGYFQKDLPEGSQSQKEEAKRLLPKGNSVSSKLRKIAFVGSDGKLNAEGRKYYNVNGDGSLTFDELELRKEAVKNNNWDTFDKYFTMTEGLNTSKMSKADKAKKEKQLLSLWYKDQMTDRDGAIVNALYRRIAKESGSWYQGESVTDSFRKALEKERAARKNWRKDGYSKESASKVRSARRELSKAVLRDLGFEINSDNIELIEGWIIDD